MEKFMSINDAINGFVWGPVMLVLLIGCGVYLSIRMGFIQFTRFGFAMKNTLGKIFKKQDAAEGEVTPFQAVSTALASTVGTGNIAGVTGAIFAGGPGAVFWMWLSAIFGMCTKYAEVLLAVNYREKNIKGDWVGGPMYYIKNGLGKSWKWLGGLFCVFGALAAFGIGNMTQVNTIASSINSCIDAFGGNVEASTVVLLGQTVPVSSVVIGVIIMILVAIVLFGGIKGIGRVTEKLVPFMAVVYILAALIVVIVNIKYLGGVFGAIFGEAFTPRAAIGGGIGITIQKGFARGVFSNEAGLGSAPMAHAATSETNPVRQGLYGIFEVFMDTIVICTLTSFVVIIGNLNGAIGMQIGDPAGGGTAQVIESFSGVFGAKIGSLIVAVGITCFAFSTVLGWSLYGIRCFEFLCGTKASAIYKWVFIIVILIGTTLTLNTVWGIADTLNGLMAIPNLIALFALSPVVIKLTKEFFSDPKNLEDTDKTA